MTDKRKDDVMVDENGKVRTLGAGAVHARVDDILMAPTTRMLLSIGVAENGHVAVATFGPPSRDTLTLLEQVLEQYRAAIDHKLLM